VAIRQSTGTAERYSRWRTVSEGKSAVGQNRKPPISNRGFCYPPIPAIR